MRFNVGDDVFDTVTGVPVRVERVNHSMITVSKFDPAGTGSRLLLECSPESLETFAERNERLDQDADAKRGPRAAPPKNAPLSRLT